ncbi:hypothetical protein GW17_00059538, partial [Ensete ventricosum]
MAKPQGVVSHGQPARDERSRAWLSPVGATLVGTAPARSRADVAYIRVAIAVGTRRGQKGLK